MANEIITISNKDIEALIAESRASDRKRKFKLVRSSDKGVTPAIMMNALQPGTYVTPHQHPTKNGSEVYNILGGHLKVVLFDGDGELTHAYDFCRDSESGKANLQVVEIPPFTYHSVIVMKEDSVMVEYYKDVFNPKTYKEFAPWAPEEGKDSDEKCKEYLGALLERAEGFQKNQ